MASIAEGKKIFQAARTIVSEFNTTQLRHFFKRFPYDELCKIEKQLQFAKNDQVGDQVKQMEALVEKTQAEIAKLKEGG